MRKSNLYLIVSGFVLAVAVAFTGTGMIASAQNTNSSTTGTPAKAKTKHRAKHKAATSGRCDPMQQEQTDLSGEYTGKVDYPDASLSGDASLTITGNNFTLTAGSSSASGRVTAVTTCGYTGATMMFGDTTPPDPTKPPPLPLPAVSLRAKKMGNHVTLTTVPGETRSFSFASAGSRPRTMHKAMHKAKSKTKAKPAAAATPPE